MRVLLRPLTGATPSGIGTSLVSSGRRRLRLELHYAGSKIAVHGLVLQNLVPAAAPITVSQQRSPRLCSLSAERRSEPTPATRGQKEMEDADADEVTALQLPRPSRTSKRRARGAQGVGRGGGRPPPLDRRHARRASRRRRRGREAGGGARARIEAAAAPLLEDAGRRRRRRRCRPRTKADDGAGWPRSGRAPAAATRPTPPQKRWRSWGDGGRAPSSVKYWSSDPERLPAPVRASVGPGRPELLPAAAAGRRGHAFVWRAYCRPAASCWRRNCIYRRMCGAGRRASSKRNFDGSQEEESLDSSSSSFFVAERRRNAVLLEQLEKAIRKEYVHFGETRASTGRRPTTRSSRRWREAVVAVFARTTRPDHVAGHGCVNLLAVAHGPALLGARRGRRRRRRVHS